MVLFTVLATLLCSSLVDARLTPVKTPEALTLCQSQPDCKNPAVDISPAFYPIVKAPASKVNVRLAVESNQRLTFPVKADKATWEIKGPSDKCSWKIISDGQGGFFFREWLGQEKKAEKYCDGTDVRYTVYVDDGQFLVDATSTSGEFCKESSPKKLGCEYTPPDSASIPDMDVWTLSISSSDTASGVSITLEDAYFIYYQLETTTTMLTTNGNGTGNDTTTNPSNPGKGDGGTTPDVGFSSAMGYGLMGACGLLVVLLVIAVTVAIIACIKLRKPRSPKKEEPRKKDGLDDRSKPIPLDGNGILPEIAICESKSKRMVDEKQLAAAESAQKPAAGEAPGEPNGQDVVNKGPDGTSTQPAAYPTSI
ncbi:hypothetical protein AAVH_05829 [Aphelenchoides avenae]|nr:hypothetical protein AAVH_05829 [Aphelenchus avenae]